MFSVAGLIEKILLLLSVKVVKITLLIGKIGNWLFCLFEIVSGVIVLNNIYIILGLFLNSGIVQALICVFYMAYEYIIISYFLSAVFSYWGRLLLNCVKSFIPVFFF